MVGLDISLVESLWKEIPEGGNHKMQDRRSREDTSSDHGPLVPALRWRMGTVVASRCCQEYLFYLDPLHSSTPLFAWCTAPCRATPATPHLLSQASSPFHPFYSISLKQPISSNVSPPLSSYSFSLSLAPSAASPQTPLILLPLGPLLGPTISLHLLLSSLLSHGSFSTCFLRPLRAIHPPSTISICPTSTLLIVALSVPHLAGFISDQATEFVSTLLHIITDWRTRISTDAIATLLKTKISPTASSLGKFDLLKITYRFIICCAAVGRIHQGLF